MRIADEIESFFHVTLYNALRYLRHTCTTLEMTMFDYFDQFQFNNDRYRCGADKRNAIKYAELTESGGDDYEFIGDGYDTAGNSTHPINSVLANMLIWFRARYVKKTRKVTAIGAVVKKMALRESNKAATNQSAHGSATTDANALDNHDAFLEMLDEELQKDWPTNDKVGDQLRKRRSAQRAVSIPAPDFNAATDDGDDDQEGQGDGDEGIVNDPIAEPAAKRPRLKASRKGKVSTQRG